VRVWGKQGSGGFLDGQLKSVAGWRRAFMGSARASGRGIRNRAGARSAQPPNPTARGPNAKRGRAASLKGPPMRPLVPGAGRWVGMPGRQPLDFMPPPLQAAGTPGAPGAPSRLSLSSTAGSTGRTMSAHGFLRLHVPAYARVLEHQRGCPADALCAAPPPCPPPPCAHSSAFKSGSPLRRLLSQHGLHAHSHHFQKVLFANSSRIGQEPSLAPSRADR
jgi:hypothetical protein